MAQLLFLGSQILEIYPSWMDLQRHPFHDFQTIAFDADDLSRIVRDEPDPSQSEARENLCSDTVVSQIRFEAQLQIRLDRIAALILKAIGFDFVEEADAAPFLIEVQQHATSLVLDHLHGVMQLVAAVAAQRAQHIGGQATGMHPHQNGISPLHTPLH